MEPLWVMSKPPRPTPWARIMVSLTGTALLIAIGCHHNWSAGAMIVLWPGLLLSAWAGHK
jgi:hypothetical protein